MRRSSSPATSVCPTISGGAPSVAGSSDCFGSAPSWRLPWIFLSPGEAPARSWFGRTTASEVGPRGVVPALAGIETALTAHAGGARPLISCPPVRCRGPSLRLVLAGFSPALQLARSAAAAVCAYCQTVVPELSHVPALAVAAKKHVPGGSSADDRVDRQDADPGSDQSASSGFLLGSSSIVPCACVDVLLVLCSRQLQIVEMIASFFLGRKDLLLRELLHSPA